MKGSIAVTLDELIITSPGERGRGQQVFASPAVVDEDGSRVMLLLDQRRLGGPLEVYAFSAETAYTFAMAVLKMRRRILAARKQPSPSPPSQDVP